MTDLVFKGFGGIEPVLDQCLQEQNKARVAHDVKLWHGRLDAFRVPLKVKDFENAGAVHQRDCCWRMAEDPCTRFVDVLCGPTIISSPSTLPSQVEDFCDPDSPICPLGIPCPDAPDVAAIDGSEPSVHSHVRTYVITYGDECVFGAPSPSSQVFQCTNKDDCFVVTLPQPDAVYCNVTKIRIYRLMVTTDVTNPAAHGTAEHRSQGLSAPGASEAEWFEVGCVDVGTTTFTDKGSAQAVALGSALISEDFEEPPCGMVVHGMFDSGALVGSIGDKLRFSEFNTDHAWPCKYEITLPAPIIEVCVCDTFAFVFTAKGVSIVRDTLDAIDNFCRPKTDVKRHLPVYSHKGVICLNGQAVFVSKNGVYRVDSTGNVQLLTTQFGTDNWAMAHPQSMRIGLYDYRLVMSSNTFSAVYDIDLFGDGAPATNTLATLSDCPACWVNDENGNLHMLTAEGLWQWDCGDTYKAFKWRSGDRLYEGFDIVTAARVRHASSLVHKGRLIDGTVLTIFCDGCEAYQRAVDRSEPIRTNKLSGGHYGVEVAGKRSITSVTLAASIRCMSRA